jgi:2,3-bisphosphoglycerate-independent phosphoglycerate mutase
VPNNQKLILLILDGWGIAPKGKGNAVSLANKPTFDRLWRLFPHTQLNAHGKFVGLPDNQVGNSEAGHLNIGAGKIVEQDSVKISKAIKDGTFHKNPAFKTIFQHTKKNNSNLHLMGILSDENSPHSSLEHLRALIDSARENNIKKIHLHLFTDGRDTLQHIALNVLEQLHAQHRVPIVSIIGRFFAMDRNKNWERTQAAYDCLTLGNCKHFFNYHDAIFHAYNSGATDEQIPPSVIAKTKSEIHESRINDNDGVIFFNLRSDRARQLTKCFVQPNFNKQNPGAFRRRKVLKNIKFCALTDFGTDLDDIQTAFPSASLTNTIPIMFANYRQLYVAESEKYAHMTYFINGGYADPVNGEQRLRIASPQIENYAQKPEMNVYEITNAVIENLAHSDFIAVNFANPDMVGHTGDLKATIKAVEHCDICLKTIAEAAEKENAILVITADHGNAEKMLDPQTNEIYPLHTINPVPFIIIHKDFQKIKLQKGSLCNIAPTIYKLFEIEYSPKTGLAKPLF